MATRKGVPKAPPRVTPNKFLIALKHKNMDVFKCEWSVWDSVELLSLAKCSGRAWVVAERAGMSVVAVDYRFRSLCARGAAAAALAAALPYMSIRGQRGKSEEKREGAKGTPPLSLFVVAKPAPIFPPPRPLSVYPGCLACPRCCAQSTWLLRTIKTT